MLHIFAGVLGKINILPNNIRNFNYLVDTTGGAGQEKTTLNKAAAVVLTQRLHPGKGRACTPEGRMGERCADLGFGLGCEYNCHCLALPGPAPLSPSLSVPLVREARTAELVTCDKGTTQVRDQSLHQSLQFKNSLLYLPWQWSMEKDCQGF